MIDRDTVTSLEKPPPDPAELAPKPPDRPPYPEDGILLRAEGVTKRFEGLTANRDIDFDIPTHSIVAIIGPNGAGKTTFFNQMTGIDAPTSGTIGFAGIDITGMSPDDVAELGSRAPTRTSGSSKYDRAGECPGRPARPQRGQFFEAILRTPPSGQKRSR